MVVDKELKQTMCSMCSSRGAGIQTGTGGRFHLVACWSPNPTPAHSLVKIPLLFFIHKQLYDI